MDLIVGNPMGLWALLGIPAVLLIHLLQHEARPYSVSTLFLLEHLAQESTEGRVIERIRNSAQLWLQLLGVLLLTWLLIQPRWLREDSFQRVVVVLDSSVSMTAFLDELPEVLDDELADLVRASANTEWRLIETDPGRESLYAGARLNELVAQVGDWRPRLGTHSVDGAFQVARSLAGGEGTVVFVSDQEPESLPDGVELLTVGEPLDNVGFTGLRLEADEDTGEPRWQAMVRNYSDISQQRTWRVEGKEARGEGRTLELDAGETRVLRGTFPPDTDAIALVLDADAFELDDRLPMVRPYPKRLTLARRMVPELAPFADKFVASLENTDRVRRSESPDLELLSYQPGVVPAVSANAICLPIPGDVEEAIADEPGFVVAESHSLTDGLTWQGLLCRALPGVTWTADDTVLVWQGKRPLVYLREADQKRQLVVAFDTTASNADRLPAFVVLLHRFAESIRADKPAFQAINLEVNQRLDVAADLERGAVEVRAETVESLPLSRLRLLRSPYEPGWFEAAQGTNLLLSAAARFADSREADFQFALRTSLDRARAELITRRNSREDPWAPLWALLVAGTLIASWAVPGRKA